MRSKSSALASVSRVTTAGSLGRTKAARLSGIPTAHHSSAVSSRTSAESRTRVAGCEGILAADSPTETVRWMPVRTASSRVTNGAGLSRQARWCAGISISAPDSTVPTSIVRGAATGVATSDGGVSSSKARTTSSTGPPPRFTTRTPAIAETRLWTSA
ncbi:Uncharacterised protein [Mycobacteroides abscessus]|nr:Uncharacterised protein [Mycobacteroides abscessus]